MSAERITERGVRPRTTSGPPRKAGPTGSIHRIGKRIKGKLDAGERKIDLYQIGTDAAEREAEEFGGKFAAEGMAAEAECG